MCAGPPSGAQQGSGQRGRAETAGPLAPLAPQPCSLPGNIPTPIPGKEHNVHWLGSCLTSPTPLSWAARRFLTRTGSIQGAKPRGQRGRETHRLPGCQQQEIFPGRLRSPAFTGPLPCTSPTCSVLRESAHLSLPPAVVAGGSRDLVLADEDTEAQVRELVQRGTGKSWDGAQALHPAGGTSTSCPAPPQPRTLSQGAPGLPPSLGCPPGGPGHGGLAPPQGALETPPWRVINLPRREGPHVRVQGSPLLGGRRCEVCAPTASTAPQPRPSTAGTELVAPTDPTRLSQPHLFQMSSWPLRAPEGQATG